MSLAIRILIAGSLFSLTTTTVARAADPNSVALMHAESVSRACATGDVDTVLSFYEDDAIAVWPGQGQEAKGKDAIRTMATKACTGKGQEPVLKAIEAWALGKGYILTNGRWETSAKQPDGTSTVTVLRTTEVLKETDGKWRYVLDHVSVGAPAQSGGMSPRTKP